MCRGDYIMLLIGLAWFALWRLTSPRALAVSSCCPPCDWSLVQLLFASSGPDGVCGAVFKVGQIAAGLRKHCSCALCCSCRINLCLLVHHGGCQIPEGPDYLLYLITLHANWRIDAECASCFPLLLSWTKLDEGAGVGAVFRCNTR